MKPPNAANSPQTAVAAQAPSPTVRTVVSFLLFVHLFALSLGIFTNENPSALERKLGTVPLLREYREALWMDLPYTYYLTRGNNPGGELDIDHSIVAAVRLANGEVENVSLPDASVWPRQRANRYRMLARRLATYTLNEMTGSQNTLAQSIAGGILKQHDAQALLLRCQGKLTPPDMDEFRPDLPANFSRIRNHYEADAFMSGDTVELHKIEPARDTAPPPKDN